MSENFGKTNASQAFAAISFDSGGVPPPLRTPGQCATTYMNKFTPSFSES